MKLEFEVDAPSEEVQGVKEQIAMMLEQMGYRDIRCVSVKGVWPEQMKMKG